jgi:hybrid polyketide synthase/nonribosomal peptide synthetase ACE1
MAVINGSLLIPRVKPSREQNHRYNAARRVIYKEQDLASVPVELLAKGSNYILQTSAATAEIAPRYVTIKVHKSLSTAFSVGDNGALFLISGFLSGTTTTALAFSEHNASIVKVPKNWVTLCPEPLSDALLRHVSLHVLAARVTHGMGKNQLLAVLDGQYDLLTALQTQSTARSIELLVLYSDASHSRVPAGLPSVFLNRHSTRNEISTALLANTSAIFYAYPDSSFGRRIIECQPRALAAKDVAGMMHLHSQVDDSVRSAEFSSTLRTFHRSSVQELSKSMRSMTSLSPPAMSLSEVQRQVVQRNSVILIDWTTETKCNVNIQTIHELTHLNPEKSYWLVGLTGSLGISLCHWMIRRGARTIIFTSRNPQIDPRILDELTSSGATIKVFAADVTSKDDIAALHQTLVATLPPIAGVVQGAMVLRDAMLADMTIEQFNSVLAPKVEGSKNLDALFSVDTLDFFVMFSSATCVTGNIGQSNYSVANMFMTSLARQRRKRGLAGSVINIGAILGVGYVTRETSQELQNNLLKSGHVWMSEEDFHTLFAEAVVAGSPGAGLGSDAELNSGLRIINASDAQRPLWSYSPKFQYLVREEAETNTGGGSRADASLPIRFLLTMASNTEMAMGFLRGK